MKLVRLLANLGYGSRKEVRRAIRGGAVTDLEGRALGESEAPPHDRIRYRGEPLDRPAPLVIALHKPAGYTCSTDDPDKTIYELIPDRFARRTPAFNPVGRLDKETTGLLLMTDDGQFLHRLIHPKKHCPKVYHVTLDRPLEGNEVALFASGTLILKGETHPLLPAPLAVLGEKEARITLEEGRYHQIRRMFAAAGNHVVALKRLAIGTYELPADLAEGEWRVLTPDEIAAVLSIP